MKTKLISSAVAFGFAALFLITIVFGSWFTIDQGERGVVLRNGAIVRVVEPGLGFKMPWFDSIKKITVQARQKYYENVAVYSKDQQTAILNIYVNYRISEGMVADVYENYGSEDGLVSRAITPFVSDRAETVFGQFNAVSAVTERERLTMTLRQSLAQRVKEVAGDQVIVDSVQIGNIDFSDAYEQSIEQRMQAEVEVQRIRQNLDREKVQAEIAVTQAQAIAASTVAQANAEAEAIRLRGSANAQAIRERGDALRANPDLVQLITAERWDGKLPYTMVPNTAVPFLNIVQE